MGVCPSVCPSVCVCVCVCVCEEELSGPGKVWSAFVGPGVRICYGDRIAEKKLFGPRKVFAAFVGPGVRICDGDRIAEKKLFGPRKVFSAFVGPGVRIYDGDRVVEQTFRASKSFFSIATKSGMTASAYLVNFKINLGDLAEVALIWPDLLRSTTNWAALERVSQQGRAQTKGGDVAVDDFPENIETLFHGDADQPVRPHTPTELPWSTFELRAALQKLQRNKSPDEHGLVAELLKYSTTDCHTVLFAAFTAILETGVVPGTWQKTVFTMLPKFKRALQPADFRPVASLRLLYKTFAYMILGRIEKQFDKAQPEEQHGFRANYRILEHLLTANLVIDKTVATGKPVWIVS